MVLKTYADLEAYLLQKIKSADKKISKVNNTFTRVEMWNFYMERCGDHLGQKLPLKTRHILLKNIEKDFED